MAGRKKDVARQQIFVTGAVLRIRQLCEAGSYKRGRLVARVYGRTDVLKGRRTQSVAGALNDCADAGRAVGFAFRSDLRRVVADLLKLRPKGKALALIVTHIVVAGGSFSHAGEHGANLRVRMPENGDPGAVVPWTDIPFGAGLIARSVARVLAARVVAAI